MRGLSGAALAFALAAPAAASAEDAGTSAERAPIVRVGGGVGRADLSGPAGTSTARTDRVTLPLAGAVLDGAVGFRLRPWLNGLLDGRLDYDRTRDGIAMPRLALGGQIGPRLGPFEVGAGVHFGAALFVRESSGHPILVPSVGLHGAARIVVPISHAVGAWAGIRVDLDASMNAIDDYSAFGIPQGVTVRGAALVAGVSWR